ncbi:hypothetical protein [Siminovitchia fordii]|uniref:Uncharacterized protein n=1 Tax=Siminovitchia fordii TaxID=254759 RepID=A0ABQ4KDF4_9BACI|nr:hypothetical protein [Siminovitchia fordii]GIN22918.1 hypothetical protein J1TS3_40520 [Siminovitchia fordii]
MEHRDHVFLLSLPDKKIGMTFCKSKGFDKMKARKETEHVLDNVKGFDSYELNYLGVLNYKDMDLGIKDQLHHFEKYDPVWLLVYGLKG